MKNKIKQSIDLIKKALSKFPLTYISLMLFSIILIIYIDNDSKVLETILWFLSTFGVLSYYFESKYGSKLKIYRYIILTIIPTVISLLTNYETFYNSDLFTRFIIWYFIGIIVISIYYNYKKSKLGIRNYLVSVFSNMLEIFITNFVLLIGTISIVLIFDTLILGETSLDYLEKIIILEAGFYYAPSVIYGFYNIKNPSIFVKTLITRVLYTLVLIAYLIIYIYILKILITFNIPSNQIFRITAILFIISTPVYLMEKVLETSEVINKINRIYTYLFIPFILLQIYSLGIRIYDYGFTITRYLGIMLIIFEVIYTLVIVLRKPLENVVLIFLIELTISLIIPFINCLDFSIINQAAILNKYKTSELYKAKSAYLYLNRYDTGKDKINSLLTEKEKELIFNYNDYYNDNTLYIYSSKYYEKIDVSLYNSLKFLDSLDYDNKQARFKNLDDKINSELLKVLSKYIEHSHDIDDYFDSNNEIIINENQKLILTNINIEVVKNNIEYCYFTGYLLER